VMWSCWSDQRGVGVAGRPSRRGGRSGGGEDRRRTLVGRFGEGFAPGWDRGASCTVGKLTAGSIGAEEGRVGVFHSRQETAAAMACGGASSARAGARLGSRRSGAGAG
jgi:hypothetical protein